MEWQPIETAPKDGVYFLMTFNVGGFSIASWEERPDGMSGWFDSRRASLEAWPGVKPTHWMPLPEPPELDKS